MISLGLQCLFLLTRSSLGSSILKREFSLFLIPLGLHFSLAMSCAFGIAASTSHGHRNHSPSNEPGIHFGGTLVPSSFLCTFTSRQVKPYAKQKQQIVTRLIMPEIT